MTASIALAGALEAALPAEVEMGDRASVAAVLAAALDAAREPWPEVHVRRRGVRRVRGSALAGGPRLGRARAALPRRARAGQRVRPRRRRGHPGAGPNGRRAGRGGRRSGARRRLDPRRGGPGRAHAAAGPATRSARPPSSTTPAAARWAAGCASPRPARWCACCARRAARSSWAISWSTAPATASDPVLSRLKHRYRRELADAFHTALAELGPRDRTLLRYQLVNSLSIDDIAAHLPGPPRHRRALAGPRPRRSDRVHARPPGREARHRRRRGAERPATGPSELDISVIPHLQESTIDRDR